MIIHDMHILRRGAAIVRHMLGVQRSLWSDQRATGLHMVDLVLVERGLFYEVIKDRFGSPGKVLSPLGVLLLRGRRSVVIIDRKGREVAQA